MKITHDKVVPEIGHGYTADRTNGNLPFQRRGDLAICRCGEDKVESLVRLCVSQLALSTYNDQEARTELRRAAQLRYQQLCSRAEIDALDGYA